MIGTVRRLVDLRPHPPHHPGMDRRRFLLTSLAGALAAPLAACSREPRWTLWEIKGGEAVKRESGLGRVVCEKLRDRAEREERAASELVVQIARDAARLGIKPGRATMPALYRCRPAGEEYWSIRVVRGTGRAETPWLAVQQAACGAITPT